MRLLFLPECFLPLEPLPCFYVGIGDPRRSVKVGPLLPGHVSLFLASQGRDPYAYGGRRVVRVQNTQSMRMPCDIVVQPCSLPFSIVRVLK